MAGGVRERKGSFAAYRGWTHRLKPEDVVTGGSLIVRAKSGSRGTRADRGVCPTERENGVTSGDREASEVMRWCI
jgi:hypothetical protein